MQQTLDSVLRWTGRELEPAAGERAEALLVADSWLVAEGRARAADAHWRRFNGSCARLGVGRAELGRFRAAVGARLPSAGRWFPRVELTALGLALRLRPAPPAATEATVVVGPLGDPRERPRRKGPDLELLGALRALAVARGADELLLRDGSGALLEGALSSLLWWEGGTLCTTPAERTLPGVTRALLLAAARRRRVPVRERAPQPQQLDGREVWLASALHGIRVVTAWLEPALAAGPGERAPEWRAALEGHD